jgi:hypothetical protein
VAALFSGCNTSDFLLAGSLTDDRICATVEHDFLGYPPNAGKTGPAQPKVYQADFSSKFPSILKDPALKTKIVFTDVTMTAKSGVSDFTFIDTFTINLDTVPAGGIPTTTIVDYDATFAPSGYLGVTADGQGTLVMSGKGADVSQAVLAGPIQLTILAWGTQQAQDWTADLTFCLKVEATK